MNEVSEFFNPDIKFTQIKIAQLLGISDKQVRNLINSGVLPAAKGRGGMDPLACLRSYITYKSQGNRNFEEPETDAFFDEDEDIEESDICIDTERALNVREQRRARRIQNELALKKLLPTDLCINIFSEIVSSTRGKVLAIEGKAATHLPELSKSEIRILRGLLHDTLTDLANEPIPRSLKKYMEENPFDLDAPAVIDDQ